MAFCSACKAFFSSRWLQPGTPRTLWRRGFAKVKAQKSEQRMYEAKQRFNREAFEATPETLIQSQLYTPEVLRTDNLTRNCHRLVAYGLQMPELLDRYAARAEELAAQLTPSQFSVILNAFARAAHRHDKMLKTFSKRMVPRLPQFLPMDICQTCNAYAKLREHDEVLFRRLGTEMPHKLPIFEGFQLGKVANAYARLDVRDDLLFDDIADEVIRRPQELNHVDLLLLANAFSHFRMKNQRLWPVLAEWLQQSHLDLRAQDVAAVLNAFSAVEYKPEDLLHALLLSLAQEPLLSEAKPTALGLALNALARLRWPPPADAEASQLVAALAKRTERQLEKFKPAGLMQLLHACCVLKSLRSETLVEGILERSRKLLPDFEAQSLSLLVFCCARLRKRDVPLLTQVAKAVTPLLPQFTAQALALTAHAYAKLEVRSEILFYLLAGEMTEKMPLFSGQGLGMVLKAYGTLQIHNQRLLQACRKHLRALSDELTLQEVEAIEAGLLALDSLDGSTQALLQRLRRQLGATAAVARDVADDPWGAAEESFLRRLAEEPPADQPSVQPRVAAEEPAVAMPSRPSPKPEAATDLWSLWSDDVESRKATTPAAGVGTFLPGEGAVGGATPPSRLRDYLSRPERVGRRPVVLRSRGDGDGPVSDQEGGAGGRKNSRARRQK
eukprot:TRINITY_DN61435_c0_g1_i1.p1 TRINITY_DN61435_c0_g1~~TRINITY_DN61435_c0_g1_i1.p1  ORF type:complete len:679 (-),score=154.41 TRINITY_DN61435_c0_g1_i1:7-2016(-)